MIPLLPDIDNLEEISSSEAPSIEGAWWITLQMVEHIFNSINDRDSLSNQYTEAMLSDTLENLKGIIKEDAERPLPNDTIQQLISFCSKAAQHIMENPRTKLIKEETKTSPNKLKNINSKTMNWFGKQPGRNVREKLAGNKKVLSQINSYSCDTKENQVAIKMLRELKQRINDRMENGINNAAYDFGGENDDRYDEMENFLEFCGKLKKSRLSEVKPKGTSQPNNALINDKHYSVIWRAYQLLNSYRYKIEENWDYAFERFVNTVYWAIAALLENYSNAVIVDNLALINDFQGQIDINTLNKDKFNTPEETVLILKNNLSGYKKGVVTFIEKDKGFGFIKSKNDNTYFSGASLKNQELFNSLEKHQEVYFLDKETSKGSSAYTIITSEELYLIRLRKKDLNIEACISGQVYNKSKAAFDELWNEKFLYSFELGDSSRLQFKRGINFTVGKQDYFADLKGLYEVSHKIKDEILLKCSVACEEKERLPKEESRLYQNMGLDFMSYSPQLIGDNDMTVINPEQLYTVVFEEEDKTTLNLAKAGSIYSSNSELLPLRNLVFNSSERSAYSFDAFNNTISKIKARVDLKDEDYFIYTVPDSIDEFSQKFIKIAFNLNFKKTYPVWRSISAAMYWKGAFNMDKVLNENESILVIDTHEESSNTVLLKARYNRRAKTQIFEHYSPYNLSDEDCEINYHWFLKSYLDSFLSKYGIEISQEEKDLLIKSGIVGRAVSDKEEAVQLVDIEDRQTVIKVFYDAEIYDKTNQLWLQNFNKYINALKAEELGSRRISYVIILGDYLTRSSFIDNTLRTIAGYHDYEILSTEKVLSGAVEINERLKSKQPTWYEYLPNLSLEVVKNGHYDELSLIKDQSIENIMGEEKIFEVRELLTLEKGYKSYRFPLIKGVNGKNNKEFNAKIEDKSFPLKENLSVKLEIKYKYGYENSYELIVTPVEDNKYFNSITADWVEEADLEKEDIKVQFPKTLITEEELEREVEILKDLLRRMEKIISRRIRANTITEDDIRYVIEQFQKNFYRLRRVISNDKDIVINFVREFYKGKLIEDLLSIIGIGNSIPETFYAKFNKNIINDLKSILLRFFCNFGQHVNQAMFNYALSQNIRETHRLYTSLLFTNHNKELVRDKIIEEYKKDKTILRTLSSVIWQKENIMPEFYDKKPDFIKAMISEIEYVLGKMYSSKNIFPVLFRDYCEVLLSILRLRGRENFTMLKTGSYQSLKLAKYIRKIDAKLYENGLSFKGRVKFDNLDKGETLINMSDLAFVLNKYLTGDEGANLIVVSGIEDSEESED